MYKNENLEAEFSDLTSLILGCCFEVINELGIGYLEIVYKNSLCLALQQKGLKVESEKPFEVRFRGQRVGFYQADIIVNDVVLVELKSCKTLLLEHNAQVINYLSATDLPVGLLVNFAKRNLEYRRLYNAGSRMLNSTLRY